MAEEERKPDNPSTVTIRGLENNARRFLIGNQNITRGVERRLRRSPQLARELDTVGGLQRALTQLETIEEQRQAALNLTDYSNTMYLDQFFRGNPDNVPEAQAMAQDIGSIRGTTTAIAQELQDCCAEIKDLLEEVLSLITRSFAKQRFFITTKFNIFKNQLFDLLNQGFEQLTSHINDSNEHLKEFINHQADGLKEEIKECVQVEAEGVKEDLKEYIRVESESIKQDVKVHLDYAEARIIAALEEGFASVTTAITVAVEGLLKAQTAMLLTAIGAVEATVDTALYSVRSVLSRLQEIKEELSSIPENVVKRLKQVYNKHKQEVILAISEEVSLRIVGESYYKWNSTNSFYPTLVLKFKETHVFQKARVTQLKAKLKYTSAQLTDQILRELQLKIDGIKDLSYCHGPTRGNFVAKDKHFKTTVFANDKQEIETLLKAVLQVVEEPFIERNLSVTFGRKRESITRCTKPLGNTPVYVQDYNQSFRVQLYRAVLLVNGLERPIVFYKK